MRARTPQRATFLLLATTAASTLLLVVPALAAPPARATIVEGVSMGKVRLMMKKSAVVAAFGKPTSCLELYTGLVDCQWLAPTHPPNFVGAVSVRFWKGAAIEIHLMAPDRARPEYRNVPLLSGWKTTKGIGLGSSASSVRAAYGHALTQQNYPAGVRLKLISKRGGRRVETWFEVGPSASSVWEIIILTPGGG